MKQAKVFKIKGVDFAGRLYYKHPTLRKKRKQADPTASTDPPSTNGSVLEPTSEPPDMDPLTEAPPWNQRRKMKKISKETNPQSKGKAKSNSEELCFPIYLCCDKGHPFEGVYYVLGQCPDIQVRLQPSEGLKIRSSHPGPSGNVKNRVDLFRQPSPKVERVLGTHGSDHEGFTAVIQWLRMLAI
ncbi:hypothetical protein OUZ56_003525 [Daphnia magna]|uniref:Uncharacterized protein n=1 Tax=Daphnia magna TaxID=35525 RepID=A0ABR0A978_9CRUS|nr:hypothetical protein OUZ56_003525 [Daphnia magna]